MRPAHWHAPTASGPVNATVALPGSKSMTNRGLVLAALSDGVSLLREPLRSRDTLLMAAGLRELGVQVADEGGDWRVRPAPLAQGTSAAGGARTPANGTPTDVHIDVGNAGTVLRFLPPVAALAYGNVHFDGDSRARERPLAPLLHGLRELGADVDDGGRGAVPLTVRAGGGVHGGPLTLDASASSQLVSGLLLAAPRFGKGVELRHSGLPLPSQPHVAMTVSMLRGAGAEVDTSTPDTWRVAPSTLRAGELHIEPDLSNAAPFLAAALATGGEVRVPGWPQRTVQPGAALRELFMMMGADAASATTGLTVRGSDRIRGIDADLHDVGELAPTLTAVAALAESPSRLRGIAHLRRHETDRLDALARELNSLGGDVTQRGDGLLIRPRRLHGGVFHTYDDHRLATAAAVLGLVVPGIQVEDAATTGKTLPGFTELWTGMLAGESGAGS